MDWQFREGEVFAHYLLDRKVSDAARLQRWVATSQQTGDRVCLTVLDTAAGTETWQKIQADVNRLRGLVHENISTVSSAAVDDGFCYLVEPYFRDGHPLQPRGAGDQHWPVIRQLIETVAYCHSLGIVHGSIQPQNILVDAHGHLRLTGFVTASLLLDPDCASPQAAGGAEPDITDDIYSIGQVVFLLIAGKYWKPGVQIDTPLPHVAGQMLRDMLSENSVDRQVDLEDLLGALTEHFEKADQGIQSVSFSRADATAELPRQQLDTVVSSREGEGVSMTVALGGLALIIILGALLIPLLPGDPPSTQPLPAGGNTSPPQAAAQQPGTGAEPAPLPRMTPLEAARAEHLKQEGERLGRDILKLQIQLEDAGVALWAAEPYNVQVARLDEADVLYRENRFDEAFLAYETVHDELTRMVERMPEILAEQIAIGEAALESGNAEAAMTAYTIATRLAPEEADLADKLVRAENLEETVRLTRQAEAHERNGDLLPARDAFREAAALDAGWKPASLGLARVRSAIRQRDFRQAMSRGFEGIATHDYAAARDGFNAARDILPSSPEPADGLLQVEQAERNDEIARHRRDAENAMAAHEWEAAIAAFDKALSIAPSLEFALTGKALAAERLALEQNVAEFLADPTLLQADSAYSEASRLIREAARIPDAGDDFLRDINMLAQLVSVARVEIPVTIRSDGDTDITVRKHSALGRIISETVYLIPGKYTIVGERAGYRDVRHELVLLPGRPAPVITLASDERVR